MKLLYLKGASTSARDVKYITAYFNEGGMTIDSIYDSYKRLSFLGKPKIQRVLSNSISYLYPNECEFNLVCQGTGCNLGLILANADERINKLVLVSPSFIHPFEDEKEEIVKKAQKEKFFGEFIDDTPKNPSIDEIRSLILFARTQQMSGEIIKGLENQMLILYSAGDISISPEYISELSERENVNAYEINSCHHNPIISRPEKSLRLIKDFIR